MKCPTPIYIHYQCSAFPRVTWRKHLLVSHNLPLHPSSTALSSLDHCNFSALTPKNCCIKAGVFCQTTSREGENPQRQGTKRGAKPGLAGLCAQHQVITSLLILPCVDVQLDLGPWLQTNCCSREFVKEMSVHVGGRVRVNLIGHVYSGRRAENICIQWHGPICYNFGSHFHLQER